VIYFVYFIIVFDFARPKHDLNSMAASDTIAIAFVVESSLTLAAEWHRVITEYVSQMLKRLSETHPGCKVCILYLHSQFESLSEQTLISFAWHL